MSSPPMRCVSFVLHSTSTISVSCAFIERVNKGGVNSLKHGTVRRKIPLEKAHFSAIKVMLRRYFQTAPTNAATLVSKGFSGYTRYPIP